MRRPRLIRLLPAFFPAVAACATVPPVGPLPPPTTAEPARIELTMAGDERPRPLSVDQIDLWHGTAVADPYRWLEDGDSAATKRFDQQQNRWFAKYLANVPARGPFEARIAKLLERGSVSLPVLRKSKGKSLYFHQKREGAATQPSVYVREGFEGKDRQVLDGASLAADGTAAIDWWFPSPDGSKLAWGRSDSGSEESVLHVRDVATGKDLEDVIPHTRHATVAWLPDGTAFYYTRYPAPGEVPAGEEKYGSKVFFHKLGAKPTDDALVFGNGRDKTDTPQVQLSPDGRWLLVSVHRGWDKTELFLADRKTPALLFAPLAGIGEAKAIYDARFVKDALCILTNSENPKFDLFSTKPEASLLRKNWTKIAGGDAKSTLTDFAPTKDGYALTFLEDAASRVEMRDRAGKKTGDRALPTLGAASIGGAEDGSETFLSFASYASPPVVSRMEAASKQLPSGLRLFSRVAGDEPGGEEIVVQRLFAKSKDGTSVPLFVVAKKSVLDGTPHATILYGYGGFNVNQAPTYSPRVLTAVREGAIWATAILRGGGEYGEEWHRAGMLDKKQNVFDDYYAAAEALIAAKLTDSSHLAAMGGSNGGLLVATAITQRPELFRAGASLVPLTDMLRYPQFRIAKLWIPEYGTAEDPKQFPFLYAYSPYHNVKTGTRYPAMLFTTAESDSRVDPMHARKMAARLQAVQTDSTRGIFLRVESKAGHGAGKPTTKIAAEYADELSFLFHETGLTGW